MPVNHIIDNELRLIITTWEGDAHDVEMIEAIKIYQQEIQSQPEFHGYNELLEFSENSKIKVSTEGVKNIGRIASATDSLDKRRKLAVVVHSNFAFGMARMYEAYRSLSSKSSKEIRVFKSKDDALVWLKKDTVASNV